MKKYLSILLCMTLLAGVAALGSCSQENGGAGVTEEVTLPDMTDNRVPSENIISQYEERLAAAFLDVSPVPADDLTYTVDDRGATITGYVGGEIIIVLPDTVEDTPVVAIGEKAFSGIPVEALYIPDSVEIVGFGALERCNSLRTLRTPVITAGDVHPYFGALFGASSYEVNGSAVPRKLTTLLVAGEVTEIPDYAFYGCTGLVCVGVPNSLASMGKFAFWGCSSLAWLDLSETSLVTVGDRALTNCISLLRLDLPGTVERIGEGVVEGCNALEGLTLPFVGGSADGVPEMTEEEVETDKDGKIIYDRCDYLGYIFGAKSYTFTEGFVPASLIEVNLLDGCTSVPDNAFYGVSCVRDFNLPDSVTAIGRRAFYGCEQMRDLTLPRSLTTVGDAAFHGCYRLETVNGERAISLDRMGVQTFMHCVSLKTVTLPDSLTAIPNACFSGCISLETVTAKGIKNADGVGKQAYRGCEKLNEAPFMPVETESAK